MAQTWHKYSYEGGTWWWCETNGDWFLEAKSAPWTRYCDPASTREYWWRDDMNWFWIDGNHGQVGHTLTANPVLERSSKTIDDSLMHPRAIFVPSQWEGCA